MTVFHKVHDDTNELIFHSAKKLSEVHWIKITKKYQIFATDGNTYRWKYYLKNDWLNDRYLQVVLEMADMYKIITNCFHL